MILSTDIQIPFSRSIVFATYRDRLMELIPYMTNVRSIEVKSRHQDNACIHAVNEWHGGGEIRIDPKRIQGVPPLLKNQVASVVEDFLSKKVEPNLLQMSEGVRQYLDQQTIKYKLA
ncbi:MAG: hypothetical protein RIB93_16370 [Coleofasciculus sp. D1-CHI-01]|uniref:hypothetical protein n=1 Tax=Coleofasciculus sp. D1-CHI-01 TaxID=3068482 RepID=UPI003304A80D